MKHKPVDLHTVEITAPDGRKYIARGGMPIISVESKSVEITRAGIFDSYPDFMRRFTSGPQTIRFEMHVSGKVEFIAPPAPKKKRARS